MTNQDAFTTVWQHFIVEKNPPSYVQDTKEPDGIQCMYRGNDGAKCAFGIFIPDELYIDTFEKKLSAWVLEQLKRVGYRKLDGVSYNVFHYMQQFHDDAVYEYIKKQTNFHEQMEQQMRQWASTAGFTIPGE